MRTHLPAALLLFGAAALLSGCPSPPAKAPATAAPPAAPPPPGQPVAARSPAAPAEQLLELQYEPGDALTAIQERIVLPFGTPVPADTSRLVVQLVVDGIGMVEDEKIVRGISPAVDEAVRTALHDDLKFRPVQHDGVYRRVPYTLTIPAPGAHTPAQRREAATRWQRTATRLPGEADSTFVRRVLPRSYAHGNNDLLAYAWRPSAFGRQLFFTGRGGAGNDNEYGTDLYILDPYQPGTYAVQVLPLGSLGDLTNLNALFFADANHDGRKDLLALKECDLREVQEDEGKKLLGRVDHYQTDIWQYRSPDAAGRPQYRPDPTPRPYLEDLFTAAAVRRALARHHKGPR